MEPIILPDSDSTAFGAPGMAPPWQRGDKDGVGTSYSSSSRLWFTVWNGIVTEIYHPTVDHPQVRDVQFIFYDEAGLVLPEIAMKTTIEAIDNSLGYRVSGKSEGEVPFSYEKEIISDPHQACLLIHLKVTAADDVLNRLKVCTLCAPHLGATGYGNNAQVVNFVGRDFLVADHGAEWLALGTDASFEKTSVGYVGASDAWTDLHKNRALSWHFRSAPDGNVALAGEVNLSRHSEFTIFVSFGMSQHSALAGLLQSMALPYERTRQRFLDQWARLSEKFEDLASASADQGRLYETSIRLLLAHEDKAFPGAMVASLAMPWGEAHGDGDGNAGYHLIWTRDLVQSALGLLAAGQVETPLRAFLYLAASQEENGRFPQNFWVNGEPFWPGLQLDEVAFPIILAHHLWKAGAISLELIQETGLRAVSFLILAGPITQQERWEELEGLSPSTVAALITGMICAAEMAEASGDTREQAISEDYADWLESQLEHWTVTRSGTLLSDVPVHYVRANPVPSGQSPPESVDQMQVTIKNLPPSEQNTFPAKEIVDGGFLELVRYGIRRPDNPIIVDTLRVIDALLRVETPSGVLWRRYNHDGYGQQADGGSFVTFGQGRGWPLLVGERGHYELAAKRDADQYIRWMEGLATPTRLLPEQSWDAPATADGRQKPGRPTGSAVPLLWAHAEYIKLLRSQRDGRVFDLVERVQNRYLNRKRKPAAVYFWSFACPIATVPKGKVLRIVAEADFELLFTIDNWQTEERLVSKRTKLRFAFVDISKPLAIGMNLIFTFYWPDSSNWEGKNFTMMIV